MTVEDDVAGLKAAVTTLQASVADLQRRVTALEGDETAADRCDALTLRIAYLESRTGFADAQTLADLPERDAAAMLGTNPANLGAYTQAAKEARAAAGQGGT